MKQQPQVSSTRMEEREALMLEYELLKQEIHVAQSHRMQVISLTVGAFGVILSMFAGAILTATQVTPEKQMALAIMSAIATYFILIPGLIMTTSIQQAIRRSGNYMRIFIEPQIPGLSWETDVFKLSNTVGMGRGLHTLGRIFYFLSLIPLLMPVYVASVNRQYQLALLLVLPLVVWSLYLTYDLENATSKGWSSTIWKVDDSSQT